MIRIEFELVRLRSWPTSAVTSTLKSQTRIHYVVVGELSPRFAHMGPVLKLANFTSNFITNNQIASTRRTESSSSLLPSAKQIFEAPSGAKRAFRRSSHNLLPFNIPVKKIHDRNYFVQSPRNLPNVYHQNSNKTIFELKRNSKGFFPSGKSLTLIRVYIQVRINWTSPSTPRIHKLSEKLPPLRIRNTPSPR
jgi:hypothetical protein